MASPLVLRMVEPVVLVSFTTTLVIILPLVPPIVNDVPLSIVILPPVAALMVMLSVLSIFRLAPAAMFATVAVDVLLALKVPLFRVTLPASAS